ncbi:MAG: RNA methyltransferase [Gallionellales bacterium 35-53-114]|jgi:putative N6-adenine-specific DNA methylase|nr:MAG: RNA methyltransferase [Gallionellales bacterium 35-53-114]OYZ64445.1 MAG: RNA methyltransferase [Gallionellales bacterium 24-53-125]OZB10251.1 MAG: RNA methyltransferase [Gallionellales bacterium 39-52-133]HQS56841.1 THUMP domain-containing protein [Gallionellaceae bacterium]HQS75375.1 THUMP domain-containing protein [Gallionellaceae bacterium]
MTEQFFSPCPRGLEIPLSEELKALGAEGIHITEGGVHFSGPGSLSYRVNLHSRTASRVLWRVAKARYTTEQDIYDTVHALPWKDWFDESLTIRVNMAAIKCPLRSLDFATLKIKDAICDKFREITGERPSVNTHAPDIRIHAFLDELQMSLYVDTSGDALFKRGVRQYTNIAPLRENLAAGILMLSGWKPGTPLLDPMCGSGTFLIEAAQMSLNIAPGIGRHFAFEKLHTFNEEKWQAMRAEAIAAQKPVTALPVYGSDLYGEELKAARLNLENAGLLEAVTLKQANVLEINAPADHGVLVANLPYGERMGELDEMRVLYPQLGDVLKQRFKGWNAYLLTADLAMPKSIRLSVSRKTPLFNGALECRLFEYKIVAGSNRK